MNHLDQNALDSRFVIDSQIRDVFGSAFEDFGMEGIRYVVSEVGRISEGIEKLNTDGVITV